MQALKDKMSQLPDFKNLGVCLRILVLVNLMAIAHATALSNSLIELLTIFTQFSMFLQPILIVSLLILYSNNSILQKIPPIWAHICVILMTLFVANLIHYSLVNSLYLEQAPATWRVSANTIIITIVALTYFNLRRRALTPAITEARLQALQARIRPHFLFNCINAVLSIVRSEPKRAETALEDMADLFRVLMADNRDLVPLAQEIALCRQYLALEKLRLDERLNILWQIDNVPPDALIPPLVLQPLLENAVYHGIEPLPEGGSIKIHIFTSQNEVHLKLSNPFPAQGGHHAGNKMALGNIQERLALHFDAEARLNSKVVDKQYEVHIVIPYQKAAFK